MTKLCICQICNCGRHRCPHHPQSVINKTSAPCTLSEYANRYIPHPIELRKSMKPDHKPTKGDGVVSDKTTNRTDYVKYPYEQPWVRPADGYVKPEGDMDHFTNYKRDYTEKPLTKTKPIRKDTTRKTPGKFEGDPTYRHDYRKWSAEPPKKIVRDDAYRPSSQPFDGNPTYTSDYIRYNHEPPRQSMKPVHDAKGSDQPFEDTTGYRAEYTKKQMPLREAREKPKWVANKAPLDGLSNYRKDFVPKEAGKQPSCKPDNAAYRSDQPLNDETTQRADYIKWPAERPFVHEPDTYVKPDGMVDYHTTSGVDYDKKPIPTRELRKPPQRKGVTGKFDGVPSYVDDYRKWPLERVEQKKRVEYKGPDGPFEGNPTYTTDYIRYNEPVRQSLRPVENTRNSDQPFDGTTGYRDDYTKKQMPERERREKPKYTPNKAALDDLSNYRKDYTSKKIEKMPSCKPDAAAQLSDAPFNDETTQRFDYKKWPAERPFVHEPDQYRTPDGAFDFNTVHTIEYTQKPMAKTGSKKPAQRKGIPGKFDGTTNYFNDYRKWEAQQVKPKPKVEYSPPEVPFEGSSNYHDDYIKHNQAPPRSLKPANAGVHSDAPFEGGTEYRQEFDKKHLPPCPAGIIESGYPSKVGFSYRDQDPSGHKWYEHMAASVVDLKPPGATLNQQLTALSVA